jgi:hypothetical protein
MTPDKLIEAIARAIATQDGIQAGEASDFAEWHWEDTVDHAKAALAAIEEAGFAVVPVERLRQIREEAISAFHSDDPKLGLRSISLGDAYAGKISSDEAVRLIRASNAATAQGLRASPLYRQENPNDA